MTSKCIQLEKWPRWELGVLSSDLEHRGFVREDATEGLIVDEVWDCSVVCLDSEDVSDSLQKLSMRLRVCLDSLDDVHCVVLVDGVDEEGHVDDARLVWILPPVPDDGDEEDDPVVCEGEETTLASPSFPTEEVEEATEASEGRVAEDADETKDASEDVVVVAGDAGDARDAFEEEELVGDAGEHTEDASDQVADDAAKKESEEVPEDDDMPEWLRESSLPPPVSTPIVDPLPVSETNHVRRPSPISPSMDVVEDTEEPEASPSSPPPTVSSPRPVEPREELTIVRASASSEEEHHQLHLVGRIPPALLTALASQRASVPLTAGGVVLLFRQGTRVRVGTHLVDPSAYDRGIYRSELVTPSDQLASRRIPGTLPGGTGCVETNSNDGEKNPSGTYK